VFFLRVASSVGSYVTSSTTEKVEDMVLTSWSKYYRDRGRRNKVRREDNSENLGRMSGCSIEGF
jgi:hypothetical protein